MTDGHWTRSKASHTHPAIQQEHTTHRLSLLAYTSSFTQKKRTKKVTLSAGYDCV